MSFRIRRAISLRVISLTSILSRSFFALFLHQILICLDLCSFSLFILSSIAGIISIGEENDTSVSSSNWILRSYIQLCHLYFSVATYSGLMLSNDHCRWFTRNEKVSLMFAVFAVTFFIVFCVISFTFDLVDWWGSYVFINSSASKMSTHSRAQIRVKRESQPLILYHFFCMRSGRIDGYYHHHRVRSTPSRERDTRIDRWRSSTDPLEDLFWKS